MAQQRLIKMMALIVILSSAAAFASCKDLVVKNSNKEGSEKTSLCFFNDETYFISKNCQDLSCPFMSALKKRGPVTESHERPGSILCKELKGVEEGINIPGTRLTIKRCLFPEEKAFISLNLLESWDGKKFAGPSN